ncbi:hypothetical protein ZYGR_0AZ02730 [Zygosaccharomyces rouxii]|uniref:Transcription initiation factor TFIID subunit 13 n=1 Tax=Zygosaccharomyces rouxii TaxID=4956 RepID=A0A1Q3AK63_ZYGRO|nr:hypothetical protein ZYGR_0AZ02730 [Zygosaccharomyces rouxii]
MSRKLKRTNLFAKDVSSLLYAYGDVAQPLPETVQCLDELVSGYLVDVCSSAFRAAQNCQRNKLKLEDFRFAVRHDPIKLGRAEELIATNKLITEAKKQFNGSDSSSLKRFRDGEGNELEGEGDEDDDEDYEDEADEDVTGGGTTHVDDYDKHTDLEMHQKFKSNNENFFEDDNESHQVKNEKKSKSSTRGGKQGSRGGGKTRGKRQKRGSSGP